MGSRDESSSRVPVQSPSKQVRRNNLTLQEPTIRSLDGEGDMSRLNLTRWQRRRLRHQLNETRASRIHRRTLAVLEFDGGRPVADIARMLQVSRQSVYNWIETYRDAYEPSDLVDASHVGRPRLLDDDGTALIRSLLDCSPQDLGYFATNWTVPLLQEQLQRAMGQSFSDETVRRTLRRLGYEWKRPRYVLAPDPEREKKTADSPGNPGTSTTERCVG
jgi:transposase